MEITCHSDIGEIKSLFIKNAEQAFISEVHIEQYWKELNFLGKPDYRNALLEYDSFQSILKQKAAEIYYFPVNDFVNMDSIYCRDASIATNQLVVNVAKAGRLAKNCSRGPPSLSKTLTTTT